MFHENVLKAATRIIRCDGLLLSSVIIIVDGQAQGRNASLGGADFCQSLRHEADYQIFALRGLINDARVVLDIRKLAGFVRDQNARGQRSLYCRL